ncbi:MAG: T9SS type A sorting domain-containing protein [Flavobacteriales bacterium]|nr:T9SS type A sorting domain-containing protein [Flavobacteriales bacterium]
MKKVYLLAGMVLIGGVSFAQVRNNVNAPLKKFAIDKNFSEIVTPAQNSGNRAVIVSDDFSNAGNWNIATTGQGTWEIVTTMPTQQGQYMGNMASTTAANGFATFNGVQYLINGVVDPQSTTLTYGTVIDLSAHAAVTVDFEQRYRPFNSDQTFVEVSTDGGTTWTSFELNTQYAVNATAVQNTISQNISAVAGNNATVTIRFRWEETSGDDQYGSGYGWCVDDFSVNTAPNDNLVLTASAYMDPTSYNTWGYGIGYGIMPISQIASVQFAGTMENQGSANQANARLTATVVNSAGSTVFTGNGAGATLPALSSMNDTTLTAFTPAAAVDTFDITFRANYDNFATDATPANNDMMNTFYVSANQYGRDDNVYTGGGLWNGETGGVSDAFVLANLFEAKNDMDINRIRAAFTSSTDAGVIACAQIYEVDPSTGDFNLVAENCGGADEITIASNQISTGGTITWVDFVLCHTLTAGNYYLAGINHYGGAQALVVMSSPNVTAEQQTVFLLDGTNATWYYLTSVPKIRMVEGACDINVAEVASENFVLSQNIPNPANGTTTIRYSINENANVTFEIVDVTGKVIKNENFGTRSAGDYQINLDTDAFAAGVYFYSVTVNGERQTKRMIINK